MRIMWDPGKSAANLEKHGVSFEEADKLLGREAGFLVLYDEIHSCDEDRFIAVGRVRHRVIVVVFSEPDDDELRIISARVATTAERGLYEKYEKEHFHE